MAPSHYFIKFQIPQGIREYKLKLLVSMEDSYSLSQPHHNRTISQLNFHERILLSNHIKCEYP
ncbi:hypothetical protein RchiOBHm_Chr1g0379551 [Rosa chinensis]|uniref:Uncharacterized protein n=1 Tax=Rosa chinensis TaxID=74649 RepID=A0A2P6SNL9_ROSCH|nr:hypothetical protein RchiOBHm_Chr1g0379551 [Rosa chinensis]